MQFVDIKNDIAFRKIFGNENKEVILQNVDDEGLTAARKKEDDYAAMREQDERGKVELAEKRAKKEVAKKMKEKGLPNNDISDFTGLTDEEIDDL